MKNIFIIILTKEYPKGLRLCGFIQFVNVLLLHNVKKIIYTNNRRYWK